MRKRASLPKLKGQPPSDNRINHIRSKFYISVSGGIGSALGFTDLYTDPRKAYRDYRKLCQEFGSNNVFITESAYELHKSPYFPEKLRQLASQQ